MSVLCEGISSVMKIPVFENVITRPEHTDTQTRKNRIERWKNIDGKFLLMQSVAINHKHILLIDDVITTGATLESCGAELLKRLARSIVATPRLNALLSWSSDSLV